MTDPTKWLCIGNELFEKGWEISYLVYLNRVQIKKKKKKCEGDAVPFLASNLNFDHVLFVCLFFKKILR